MADKRYRTLYDFGRNKEGHSLEEVIEHTLDGSDYGRGAVEAASVTAHNNSQAISRLTALLHRKGLLTLEEVSQAVGTDIEEVGGT